MNLWVVKERLWDLLRAQVRHDPTLAIIDSVPVPVCRFGRSRVCRRFPDQAAYGYDQGSKTVYFGFRYHLRVCWPGVLAALQAAPADASDVAVAPEVVYGAIAQVLGDRNYWAPLLTEELQAAGITLLAPYRHRAEDPHPAFSHDLSRLRWRIETVAAQLVERYRRKRLWARDAWHLTSRLLRKALSHTVAVWLCLAEGLAPLQFSHLLTDP